MSTERMLVETMDPYISLIYIHTSLQHEKAVPCFRHAEKLIFIRHSSEYETSDSS